MYLQFTLYKEFLKYKKNSSLVKYKKYKNKLTSILRYEQKRYYNNLLIKCKNDIKGTWKILNREIKGKTAVNSFPDTFQDQNKTVKGNKGIANGFNNFLLMLGLIWPRRLPHQIRVLVYMIQWGLVN